MIKHIIREYIDYGEDAEIYFENADFNSDSGDFNNTIFILSSNRHCNYNSDDWENVCRQANELADILVDIEQYSCYNPYYPSFKQAMVDYGFKHSPKKSHKLKNLLKTFDDNKTEDVAEYLTLLTDKKWDVFTARGYLQGDWCEIVYCTENYVDYEIKEIGDIYLGCYKSFCVIDVDENGEGVDSCSGYLIANSRTYNEEEYKTLVCEWVGINENETQLELIDGCATQKIYSYRTVGGCNNE